jgi:(2R)-ethylmalonyl-CoA mutase
MTEKSAGHGRPPVEAEAAHAGAPAPISPVRSSNAKGQARSDLPVDARSLEDLRAKVRELGGQLGRNVKLLIAQGTGRQAGPPGPSKPPSKPPEPSSGIERLALRARDAGFEVVYETSAMTAAQLAQSAVEEGVHLVALASGTPDTPVTDVRELLAALGAVGASELLVVGVGTVSTDDLIELVRRSHGLK